MSLINNKLQIVQHHHEEFIILKNNLNATRKKKVVTNSFVQIKNLTANIFIYNGKTHRKEKITSIKLASENHGNSSFYDDYEYYTISFLEAKEGDIVEIDYDEVYAEPRFFDVFYISDYSPCMHSSLIVNYPYNMVNLKIKEVNNQKYLIKHAEDSTRKTKTLVWTIDSVTPLTDEYSDPYYRYKASYILMAVEDYRSGDSVIKLSGTLNNLYSWYRYLVRNVDLSNNGHLINLTDSLVKNETEELEKLKKIFYWVQHKIAYLAYEDGLGGYIPREASTVFNRRFGDCKDMANLIVNMCRIANLPVHHAWIGTREIPFQFTEFPAPFCANHMIAVYASKKDTLFLDATGKGHPFKLPTSMIQGKEALVGIDSNHYFIAKVPFTKSESCIRNDSILLTVWPNNKITGNGYLQLTGYQKIDLLDGLDKKNFDSQKNYLKDVLEKGNNKFKLDTFYITDQQLENALLVYYKFTISDYLTQTGDQTYINLNFLKDYFDAFNLAKRRNDIYFEYSTIEKLSVTVNLDKKHKVDFIPSNASMKNSSFDYELKYNLLPDAIHFANIIHINKTHITSANFAEVETLITSYKKNKSNLVLLTKIK